MPISQSELRDLLLAYRQENWKGIQTPECSGVRLSIRSLDLHPEWFWIGIALVLSYAMFCGFALLAGLDNDDKMIVAAIRSRVLGAMGRTPSFSQ
jgi:hypothetical protein